MRQDHRLRPLPLPRLQPQCRQFSLAAIDLLSWMHVLLLDGELAAAEPKKLRFRLLHVAARLTRGSQRLRLRISATWPWRHGAFSVVPLQGEDGGGD